MKILLTAATKFELNAVYKQLFNQELSKNFVSENFYNLNIDFAVTGIGVVNTVYNLVKLLSRERYYLAINIGLAGSFVPKKIGIGDTVMIMEEVFGDFGATDNDKKFLTIFELGLIDYDEFPFESGVLRSNYHFPDIERLVNHSNIRSLTVCNVSGEIEQIRMREFKFKADVENMEGGGFFYVMLKERVPFMELRAISNLVEPRNKERWEIMKALANLGSTLKLVLMEIAHQIDNGKYVSKV